MYVVFLLSFNSKVFNVGILIRARTAPWEGSRQFCVQKVPLPSGHAPPFLQVTESSPGALNLQPPLCTCCSAWGFPISPSSPEVSESVFSVRPVLSQTSVSLGRSLSDQAAFPYLVAFIFLLTEDSSPSFAEDICVPTEPRGW